MLRELFLFYNGKVYGLVRGGDVTIDDVVITLPYNGVEGVNIYKQPPNVVSICILTQESKFPEKFIQVFSKVPLAWKLWSFVKMIAKSETFIFTFQGIDISFNLLSNACTMHLCILHFLDKLVHVRFIIWYGNGMEKCWEFIILKMKMPYSE